MKPLVSIITPSFNQGRFIQKTIDSVLSQNYENLEYIIIDGGSTDNTHEIVSKFKDKLTYISEKDNGQSDAINKGFRMAKGEIVAWLNSDDIYEPSCIARAVEEFEKNEKLGLVYGDGYIIDENDNKLKIFEATQEFDLWTLVNVWDYIMQPATFFRSKHLKEVGYVDVNLHWCMDWDLWIKLALVSDIKYVEEIFACSREYGDTKTSTGGDKRLKEITALMQKYSGIEKPLGIQLYKSSTLYTKYANNWMSRKLYSRYMAYVHRKVFSNLPIRYADGWIGKKYSMIFGKNTRRITIELEAIYNLNLPCNIYIYINNKIRHKESISECVKKRLSLDIENNGTFNNIDIICDKIFTPSKDDKRKLSVKVISVNFQNEVF